MLREFTNSREHGESIFRIARRQRRFKLLGLTADKIEIIYVKKKYDDQTEFYKIHVGTQREFDIMAGKYNKPSSQEGLEKWDWTMCAE